VCVGVDEIVGVLVNFSVALMDEVIGEVSLSVPDAVLVELSVGLCIDV